MLGANPLNFTNIQKLNGSNYKKWKQEIDILLGLLEYDVALREEKPAALTAESTEAEKSHFANWEKSNRLSLLIIQNAMEEHVRGGIKKCDTAKDFLAAISEKYQKSQKVETGNFLSTFTTMKHDGIGSVREHLLKMVDVANKLTSLEIPINDEFIVHMALNSLTPEYEKIKVSYHTQKDKWSVNELISICCEQEDRLKKGKIVAINLVDIVNGKKAGGPKKNGNQKIGGSKGGSTFGKKFSNDSAVPAKSAQNPRTSENLKVNKKIAKCYFCQKYGHVRKDCDGFKAWLVKKGNNTVFNNHFINGFRRERMQSKENYRVFVGNGSRLEVESVGSIELKLSSGFLLFLNKVLYVPSMRRNLVSASSLVKDGFAFTGDSEILKLFRNDKLNDLLGHAFMSGDLWQIQCTEVQECFNIEYSAPKRMLTNENSSMLWHRRLGHISKDRMTRSDRGGEYFGRYTEAGQQKGPFAIYLQESGIVAQYTTPGTPQQNGVAGGGTELLKTW
ncbi:hypothetical protein L3X38_043431 [Prunus dulcis]|uniref:CCHC-type domain-containing protein n=1 Tax=Prunus dulcis TaxID=3755 RepID=A0AAD4UWQ0_PRUDU|nr:hypothetical protein L3X38_043431 [Prunus dulcis]